MSHSPRAREARHPGAGRSRPRARHLAPLLLGLLATAPAGAQEEGGAVAFTELPAVQTPTVTDSLMLAVTRAGDRLVAVGDRGFIVWSDDAGESWQQAEVPLSLTLTTVAFTDARRGWAGGHQGVLLSTDDGGASWTERFDGVDATLQEVALAEERVEAAQEALDALEDDADAETADEAALRLEDAEWALEDLQTALDEGPSNPFLNLWFDDTGNGLAVGAYGYLFRTSDGGESWRLASRNIENPDKYHYYGVAAARDGTLYLVGEAGLLFRSADGGASWTTLESPYSGSYFGVVTGTDGDEDFVLVFGLRGNIFRSTDGGAQWTRIAGGTESSLTAGTTLPDGRIVLVGNSGAVLVSDDAGRSFSTRYREDRLSQSGVAAADAGHVVVAGAGGVERVAIP